MDEQPTHIAEQAARYLARSPVETSDARRAREAWLAADARHRRAYDEMQQLWDHVGNLRDDAELKAFTARGRAALRRSPWPTRMLLAAAVLTFLTCGIWLVLWLKTASPPVRYTTSIGERHIAVLPDGTQVVLNTDSALEARFTRGRRDVALQRGEAQFDVAHDASRPFVVQTGVGTVTALGTRFQVRRDDGGAVVTLLRGSVEVADEGNRRTLVPNDQARLSDRGGIAVQTIDPAQVSGWLDGWLHFTDATLGEVVAEANRYSPRKLRLTDARLAHLRLHGNFRAGDTASIAVAAEQLLPIHVEERGNEIVLNPKQAKKLEPAR